LNQMDRKTVDVVSAKRPEAPDNRGLCVPSGREGARHPKDVSRTASAGSLRHGSLTRRNA